MNGAQALLNVLVEAGIKVCFANPGTSEMHLVLAIGETDAVRPILCLFEGVVTGAADGYGRMADKPAITLLHMGPGFSNGMANLHNAKKAHVPIVNIVGDHATYHLKYNSPLTSDILAHAKVCSNWIHVSKSADDLAVSGAIAVQSAMKGSGKIATLIVPANHAWEKASEEMAMLQSIAPIETVLPASVDEIVKALTNGRPSALILGGRALREEALEVAGRIADITGAKLLCETFPARLQRGAGRVRVARIPYFAENGVEFLKAYDQFILVDAQIPVAFFAYPGKPSLLIPEGCEVKTLVPVDTCALTVLKSLAEKLKAAAEPGGLQARVEMPLPTGALTPRTIGISLNILLPEQAILSDEGVTCALDIYNCTESAAPHDWLTLTGGSIGQGLPLSLGAAVACPHRKVVALQADGSAMYTVQALWTMAREKTDVTVVLLNNRSYAILNIEMARVGAGQPNDKMLSMLNLSSPSIDWVHIAQGMGVPATRARTADEFHLQFAEAMKKKGPCLIDAVIQNPGNI
ncbi:MAG: acetolactate synthase large subunit [Pseudomonadota bacterium]